MFKGFTKQASKFMWDLAFNNERPWFNAHKQEFEQLVMTPFKELACDTDRIMQQRHPDMGLMLHISRIYRDARRLHGRGPYKDHLWFSLKNWDGLLQGPMFWFEFGAADYSYGMGFYSATASQMQSFRAAVDANPARLERLARTLEEQNEFYLTGEEYKRPKGDVGELLNPWYNRKWLGLECSRDFGGDLLKAKLPEKLADSFDFLMPFYEYFMQLCQPEE
ncbi:MAG: DUF2461 domain-containing protein [Butyricicoccus sp.]|nr:DUF2461 domain-containing protein [Butyricicoccus sp.]